MIRRITTVVLGCALALVACANERTPLQIGAVCRLNSDCGQPLQCKFGGCRRTCVQSRDCDPDDRCVQVDGVGVCRTKSELACVGGCRAPLVCGPDRQCRNVCNDPTQCGAGQICVPGASPAPGVCADADDPLITGASAPPPQPTADAGAPGRDAAEQDAPASADPTTCQTAGGACCANNTCGKGLACTKASARCTCVAGCAGSTVLRQDGTLLLKNGELVKGADGQPFKADGALDLAASWSTQVDQQGGCVVRKDTTVWCWGHNMNGRLGAGLTDPAAGATARQVLTTAQLPLTGVRKIASYFSAHTTCARDENGHVWCWGLGGRGQLGNGAVADSNVATQVVLAVGGEALTEIVDVAVSFHLACARKTNGTVWCWGSGLGQFPKMVIEFGAASLACSIEFCCALSTFPGTVACWDGPDPAESFYLTSGGKPVNGVAAISAGRGDYMQALKHDLTMLEWNKTFMPMPVQDEGLIVTAPHLLGNGCFVTSEGRHLPTSAIPSCD